MAEPLEMGDLENDNGLGDSNHVNNSSAEESADEDRDVKINQLMADEFDAVTFDDGENPDDESVHSFTESEHSKFQDHGRTSVETETSMHSYNENSVHSNSNPDQSENSGVSFLDNGHTTIMPKMNKNQQLQRHQFTNGRIMAAGANGNTPPQHVMHADRSIEWGNGNGNGINGGGDMSSPIEIQENNKTVSGIHKTHCPQLHNGPEGDTNGNGLEMDVVWTSTPKIELEKLQTLNSYRERQIARSDEIIDTLNKDKRALHHQVGLMQTAMKELQKSNAELEKALDLKEEEVEFHKSKIQDAIVEYDMLKRSEQDMRDENNRLVSQIGRLEQEVKLLSTIGTSTQRVEVDTIVRQIRDRHAQEIVSFKSEVANLEAELRSYKRHYYTEPKETESNSTQTDKIEAEKAKPELATPTRTNCTQTILFEDDNKKKQALTQSSSTQTEPQNLATVATQIEKVRLTSNYCQAEALPETKVYVETPPKETDVAATQTFSRCAQNSTQTETVKTLSAITTTAQSSTQTPPPPQTPTPTAENSASMNGSSTTEVQTDETLHTYEVLNSLFEKWATEVHDATKRAELAESQVQFTEVSLKKLRKKFKSLYNMTNVCRQEWKKQEEFLKNRNEEMKSRHLNVLIGLHQKFEGLDLVK